MIFYKSPAIPFMPCGYCLQSGKLFVTKSSDTARRSLAKGILLFFLSLIFWLAASGTARSETVRIGVLAFRPKPQTQAQWQPLVAGLKRKLPEYDFVIEALNYREFNEADIDSRFELIFTNPAHYIDLKYRHGLSAPLATLAKYQSGQVVSAFGGVIFTRAERTDLNDLADLRGKIIAATDQGSFGGYEMQAYELSLHGIHLDKDSSLLLTGMPHDNVVNAVLAGRADAGFIRTGVLEAMGNEGVIVQSDFKVLNRQDIDYPTLVSTRLYPEWPIVTTPHVDARLARKLMAALLTLEDDLEVTSAISIQGFEAPADYAPVEDVLRTLRVPPFDKLPILGFSDLWQLYRWQIGAASAGLLVIAFLGIRLLLANRELVLGRRLLEQQSQQIKANEQLWKFALEGAGDGVWDWQIQTGQAFFSPRWIEMLGYRSEEFVDHYQAWLDSIHADDRERVLETLNDYLAGRIAVYQTEFRMRCKDGRYKWILARGMVAERAEDGKPVRMVGTHSDIDERKQVQIALQDSFDLLNNLARQIPGFIYQYQLFPDGHSCYPYASAGIERIYEVTPEQVQQDAGLVFAVLHPDDVEDVTASIQVSAQTLEPWYQEFRVLLPKAGLRWLLGNAQPERLADTSVLWHGYISDVTARKNDEQALQEKSEALQRSNADLERFAYSVSHDMRQPLRAIAGHLQLLERGLTDRLDENSRENLSFALDGAKRMDAMIVSLLEYSRVGRKTKPKTEMRSREALDEALFFLEPAIRQSGAVIDTHGPWPTIFASLEELTRLFQNLIGNALKYQEPDNVPKIAIQSSVDGNNWQVAITDNGIGIDPSQSDRLFQFFSRLQARSRFDGTGMGLALCRRIVENHGGQIGLAFAEPGKGATFMFTIPINSDGSPDSAEFS